MLIYKLFIFIPRTAPNTQKRQLPPFPRGSGGSLKSYARNRNVAQKAVIIPISDNLSGFSPKKIRPTIALSTTEPPVSIGYCTDAGKADEATIS